MIESNEKPTPLPHIKRRPVQFTLTADLVILTIRNNNLAVLLVERGTEPFKGKYALPGGFARSGEDLETTAIRELYEETSLDGTLLGLQQLRVYSSPERDPRGPVVSLAFLAIAPDLPIPVAGSDAARSAWIPVEKAISRGLAFDHVKIVRDGVEYARNMLETTTIATRFCREEFTLAELRTVYEVVWGHELDPSNFRRKVLAAEGFVEATGRRAITPGRPAALYRRGAEQHLYAAISRIRDKPS